MKMNPKILVLAALPLLILQTGCQNSHPDKDPQNPIEGPKSQSAIHGNLGVGFESRNTTNIAPTRPPY